MSCLIHAPRLIALVLVLVITGCNLQPPISIGQRESRVGQGLVVSVTNTSDEFLNRVVVTIESPEGERKELALPTLGPRESINVGWLKLDGWPIPPGAKVTVAAEGFMSHAGPVTLE